VTGDGLVVGIVTPHAAPGPEVELPAMAGSRLSTVVSRTRLPSPGQQRSERSAPPGHAGLRVSTEPAALDSAAVTFEGCSLGAVAHASTTSGYVIGRRKEAALVERLSERFDVPAAASCAAAAAALRAHGVQQVQVVHPPWFDDEFDELGVEYFRSQGLAAVVTRATGLPDDPARVDSERVVESLERHVEDGVDAVFLAGNGFRAAGAVEELELRTGRLVVAANQALLWGILAATGISWDLTGYGRLLRRGTLPT
jgi:maleate isomerase